MLKLGILNAERWRIGELDGDIHVFAGISIRRHELSWAIHHPKGEHHQREQPQIPSFKAAAGSAALKHASASRANQTNTAARSKTASSNSQKRMRKMPNCAVESRMTEVTAKAPRRLQRIHSRQEKDAEAGVSGVCAVLLRTRLAMNQPEPANSNKNTNSNAKSVPVGVKSKQILRATSCRNLSSLVISESYHTGC